MPDFIIDDDPNTRDNAFPPGASFGYVERDYKLYPEEMFAAPSEMPLIPRSEWSDRIKEQVQTLSRLSDIRNRADDGNPFPSLDQNANDGTPRWGYCWNHSTVHTAMVIRAVNNAPYVPLSAFAAAAIIKDYKNEGGWCGLSAKFAREIGIPSQKYWPQKQVKRSLDTPEMRANAAMHRITEDWVDLTRAVYDQRLTFDQVATCLLTGVPCAVDFNWWGHSVCALDLVEVEAGSFGIRILNSWSDSWGENGTGILRGSKAVPDGAIATRVTGASAA